MGFNARQVDDDARRRRLKLGLFLGFIVLLMLALPVVVRLALRS